MQNYIILIFAVLLIGFMIFSSRRNRKRQANLFDPDGTRSEVMEPNTIDGKPTPPSNAPPPRKSE